MVDKNIPCVLKKKSPCGGHKMKKICPKCKAVADEVFSFCTQCGTKLEALDEKEEPETRLDEVAWEVPDKIILPEDTKGTPLATPAEFTKEGIPPSVLKPRQPLRSAIRFRLAKLARGEGIKAYYEIPDRPVSIGRVKSDICFPEDETVSVRHAVLKVSQNHLVLEESSTANGVFVRLKQDYPLKEGDMFLCGDQVFRVSLRPSRFHPADFVGYIAPSEPKVVATVTHILGDGRDGNVYPIQRFPFLIGREEGHIICPNDRFMSRKHAFIDLSDKGLVLRDAGSRNGTFICMRGRIELGEGDYLTIGRQLMRVEVSQP
jgi:pSer/pThr/pTyr-binding forkhead associated (FHA) protein